MPIKIHHGPPGSYKTAGAMGDDFIREAKAGRVIVTNVRGVSRHRVMQEFPDLPDSFDVIHVDDKTSEGRLKWATWFHWVPHGAFLFVDEVQDIWPKSWRESDIRRLDYPGGVDQATQDDRPKDWEQALDKHRHYNWDMTLTTPSYNKVREDVKGVADMAYKHKNLALVGWTGRYIEGAHAADDTGKNANDFVNVQNKKVPPYVFKLYDSTQTGLISDTKSGFNLFKNPRVALLLGVVACVLVFVSSRPMPAVLGGSAPSGVKAAQTTGASPSPSGPPSVPLPSAPVGALASGQAGNNLEPFETMDLRIVGAMKSGLLIKYVLAADATHWTMNELLDAGYTIEQRGFCAMKLSKDDFQRVVVCKSNPQGEQGKGLSVAERSDSPLPSPALPS